MTQHEALTAAAAMQNRCSGTVPKRWVSKWKRVPRTAVRTQWQTLGTEHAKHKWHLLINWLVPVASLCPRRGPVPIGVRLRPLYLIGGFPREPTYQKSRVLRSHFRAGRPWKISQLFRVVGLLSATFWPSHCCCARLHRKEKEKEKSTWWTEVKIHDCDVTWPKT